MHNRNITETDKPKRESKYELLRIIAILSIIAGHYTSHGINPTDAIGYETWVSGDLFNRVFCLAFPPLGSVAVIVFFLITGYFLVNNNKISLKKIVLEVWFYGIFACLIFLVGKVAGLSFPGIDKETTILSLLQFIFIPVSGGVLVRNCLLRTYFDSPIFKSNLKEPDIKTI